MFNIGLFNVLQTYIQNNNTGLVGQFNTHNYCIIVDNHSLNSPPVPLDFVNTKTIPETRKYNTMIANIPTIPTFREVIMNDERPLCMNRDRFVYRSMYVYMCFLNY